MLWCEASGNESENTIEDPDDNDMWCGYDQANANTSQTG